MTTQAFPNELHILQVDNAPAHIAGHLEIPDNIILFFFLLPVACCLLPDFCKESYVCQEFRNLVLGYGARRGFVHVDMRNGSGWRSGGEKGPRWNY